MKHRRTARKTKSPPKRGFEKMSLKSAFKRNDTKTDLEWRLKNLYERYIEVTLALASADGDLAAVCWCLARNLTAYDSAIAMCLKNDRAFSYLKRKKVDQYGSVIEYLADRMGGRSPYRVYDGVAFDGVKNFLENKGFIL